MSIPFPFPAPSLGSGAMDPIKRFRTWYAAARRSSIAQPDAMALATADRRGRPSVRFVLLKQVDASGFVFYTNASSRKGREMRGNPRAALAFHWQSLGRQVRIEGRVERVSEAEADAYWATRPRESRLAGVASDQSAPLHGRAELLSRWRELGRRYAKAEIPRPPHWTGVRLVPDSSECWSERPHRLHERESFTRSASGWTRRLLQP